MPRQLLGTAIAANTITTTQLTTTVVTQISAGGGPKVKSLIYPGNDSAANSTGGQTVYITGSGFAANAQVLVNGSAVPSQSFISASNISFTTPALSTGTYPVYIINPEDGGTAILYPGLLISGEPTWVTSAGSLSASQDELSSWSYSLSATGDTPITYALAAGNTLPTGISLAANGLISGTVSSPTGNATTYTFSVIATDAQNQDSTRQFTVTTSTGEGVLFANNVLLIHADGTNNGNNHAFVDSSNNNFTITRNGNATQGTFSPFSQTGWSAYFDGTGDYLTVADNAALRMGSGDFTIEFWMQPTSTGVATVFGKGFTGSGAILMQTLSTSGRIELWVNGSLVITESSGTYSPNNWYHIAVVRSGTSLVLYRNGVSTGSVTNSVNLNSTASLGIGGDPTNLGYTFTGYISNFRMVKGSAVYTSAFTPPTSALTAVSNTSLLTCQSNRFIDNSTNAFTITRNGDTSIQAWSPFAPTASYSTANVGGSGYFDGSGDGLALNYGSTTHSFWNNDFTIEYWVKTTATNNQQIATSWNDIAYSGGTYGINIQNGIPAVAHNQSSGTNQAPFLTSGAIAVNDNTWHHIVATQTTGAQKTFRLFVDGILRGYKQETNWTQSTSSSNIYIAQQGPNTYDEAGRYFTGHLSGFRLSNTVVAAYSTASTTTGTSVFSVPTAPPTNTANTVALLNFTNAGIFDQTAKNILETVGDAKVSTAQYKYGTGSMIFDGTGDYLVTSSSVNNRLGSGDFTIEMWLYPSNTSSAYRAIIASDAYAATTNGWTVYQNGTSIEMYYSSGGSTPNIFTATSALTSSVWQHFALVRSSGTLKAYVNGTQVASVSNSINFVGDKIFIGDNNGGDYFFNGYIDDLRITKGYARYTSNFTAPTAALKDK